MGRYTWCLAVLLFVAVPLGAQSLREKINRLFIFGAGNQPLFLAGTADPNNPAATRAHSTHFVPTAVAGNQTLIAFITEAIGGNVSRVPVSATSSGITVRFEGGVPITTSESPGPIFGERAQTLGRGRVFVGASVSLLNFKALRGVDLDDIRLNFTHTNADFAGCDTIFGGDCSLQGIPQLENDVLAFRLGLDIDVTIMSFTLTYGLLDQVDIGIALPVVSTRLSGTSEAQVIPFGGPGAAHFFGGTPSNPELTATRFEEGSASGIGDIAARVKVNLSQSDPTSFAVLGEVRFATGSTEDLLGSGDFAVRGLGIVSGQFGNFSPHANVGYLYRDGDLQNDAVLATVGFDHRLSPWAMLAFELVSELQVGESELEIPETVVIEAPFRRTVEPSSIPDRRDDFTNASFGFKFTTGPGVILVANALWPLNDGGLRPHVSWTAGLEYNF